MDKLFLDSAVLSSIVYQNQNTIPHLLGQEGFENFVFIENKDTDTQAMVCSQDDLVFVTFRGTTFDNWADWETNLNCGFARCPHGRVHAGFWWDVESVYQYILAELPRHIVAGRKLVVTGHSQGAGDANAFALKFLSEHRDIYRVIHFGGPRTVDGSAAKFLYEGWPDVFQRVVNNNDLVTRIPPRVSGYRHFGNLHYFLETGEYTTDISAWGRFLDRINGKLADIGEKNFDCIKDHMIDTEYIPLVAQALSRMAA